MSDEPVHLPCIVQIIEPHKKWAFLKTTPLTHKEAKLFEKLQEYPKRDDFYLYYGYYLSVLSPRLEKRNYDKR